MLREISDTSKILLRIVQHQVEQRVVTFEYTFGFPASSELHPDILLKVLGQIENALFPFLLLVLHILLLQKCKRLVEV